MKDIKLGTDGDFILDSNRYDVQTVNDEEQIRQKIAIAIGTNNLELSWNDEFGLDHANFIDSIKDESYIQHIIDEYLTDMFDEVVDVTIENMNLKENRELDITLNVELDDGTQLTTNTSIGGEDDII